MPVVLTNLNSSDSVLSFFRLILFFFVKFPVFSCFTDLVRLNTAEFQIKPCAIDSDYFVVVVSVLHQSIGSVVEG